MISDKLKGATFIKIKSNTGNAQEDKKPVGKEWQLMNYAEACEYKGNIALLCGSDGIRVVDIEAESKNPYFKEMCAELDKLQTFKVKTQSGGAHYYIYNEEEYSQAYENIDANKKHCGEIRNKDCYVLTPPSEVNGNKYEVIEDKNIMAVSGCTIDFEWIEKDVLLIEFEFDDRYGSQYICDESCGFDDDDCF